MYLLDTDHMSLLERGGSAGAAIRSRLRRVPLDTIATTVISYEEQTRGWLAQIAQFSQPIRQVELYAQLGRQIKNYCQIAVLEFDGFAAQEFGALKAAQLRVGTMDLKIAAIALAQNATLLSRNLSDFSKVPGLRLEDWSA